MKKLLLASAVTLAGLSVIATSSYADFSWQMRNSKYCRDNAAYNDPVCVKKVKYNKPVYVDAEESVYLEIEEPVYVDAEEPVYEAENY